MTLSPTAPSTELVDNATEARRNPDWYAKLAADLTANVATTFIVHGAGVHDYQSGTDLLPDYLSDKLERFFETVVRFNVGSLDAEPLAFSGANARDARGNKPDPNKPDPRERFEIVTGLRMPQGAGAAQPGVPDPFQALRQNQPAGAAGPPMARPLPTSNTDLVRLLMRFLRASGRMQAAVIIERADLLVPPADLGTLPDGRAAVLGMIGNAGTDTVLIDKGNPLILLAPTIESIHQDLPSAKTGIQSIEVTLPDQTERLAFAQLVEQSKGKGSVRMEVSVKEIANLTAGLYRRHILDIWLRGEQVGAITKPLVIARKNEIMRGEYAEVLETMEPRFSFDDIGGNVALKEYLLEYVVQRMKTGKVKRLSKGIVFTGPSGTGKSLFAEALAMELQINVVLLRPEKIKGSLYGQSEQNLARALAGIRANSPCVVFIDEIDQRFRRGGGGAGGAADAAENNIFGRMLEEVGDPGSRGQIMWIGATNRPDTCDAALFRPGRFDDKLPVLPPPAAEREGIFRTLVARHADGPLPALDGADWKTIVNTSDGWTGAEIEQAVITAYDLNELRNVAMPAALLQATEELIPSTRDIKLHTDLAIAACNRRELMPVEYRERARDEEALAKSAEEVDRRSGGLRARRDREID
ncbi:MAG TPA: ATP-binding protein [Chloroflexota bacterium]